MTCMACDRDDALPPFAAREMMYGTRDRFDYVECAACGSVQIQPVPSQEMLGGYYPGEYYAFQQPSRLIRFFESRRDRALAGRFDPIGKVVARKRPDAVLSSVLKAGVTKDQRILDVGCGSGMLLDRLARLGFERLSGIDPFVPAATTTPQGVPIARAYLSDVSDTVDVVMFNHSLEHVPDPVEELRMAWQLLSASGLCVVRLPTSESHAYRTYRENWAQLDPPRHLLIPSRRGMAELAGRAGFDLIKTLDDSSSFQFAVSELYRRDISIFVSGSEEMSPEIVGVISAEQNAEFERQAQDLNERGDGDQAMFVLRKAAPGS